MCSRLGSGGFDQIQKILGFERVPRKEASVAYHHVVDQSDIESVFLLEPLGREVLDDFVWVIDTSPAIDERSKDFDDFI